MDDWEIEPLVAAMDRRIEATECDLHRSLCSQVDWDDRLVCIKGAKGTGKTTRMLQFLKNHRAIARKIVAKFPILPRFNRWSDRENRMLCRGYRPMTAREKIKFVVHSVLGVDDAA